MFPQSPYKLTLILIFLCSINNLSVYLTGTIAGHFPLSRHPFKLLASKKFIEMQKKISVNHV